MKGLHGIRACVGALLACMPLFVGACDTVQPAEPGTLVVEAYFMAGHPLPAVRVHETGDVRVGPAASRIAVADASVELLLDDRTIRFDPVAGSTGTYRAAGSDADLEPRALQTFRLVVSTGSQSAEASGIIPPAIAMHSIDVQAMDHAIEAVLVDSLTFGLDSLSVSIDATEGFIYPIEVTIEWDVESGVPASAPDDFWIETRLVPRQSFSSALLDFFLLTRQILPEDGVTVDPAGRRRWTGVYAVPVLAEDAPLPEHDLFISLLRSSREYAQFQATGDEPERREPQGNVLGGVGFVGGIAVDSLTVRVH